ncbi:MAG: MAPEG family protein [Lysobacter sp.]
MPTITLLFTALHVLLLLALLVPISMHRYRHRIGLGDGGDPVLLRKIRVHANFIEHVPLAMLMLALLELGGLWPPLLWLLGTALLLARVMHAVSFSRRPGYSFGRFWGTAITWGALLSMALAGFWLSLRMQLAG